MSIYMSYTDIMWAIYSCTEVPTNLCSLFVAWQHNWVSMITCNELLSTGITITIWLILAVLENQLRYWVLEIHLLRIATAMHIYSYTFKSTLSQQQQLPCHQEFIHYIHLSICSVGTLVEVWSVSKVDTPLWVYLQYSYWHSVSLSSHLYLFILLDGSRYVLIVWLHALTHVYVIYILCSLLHFI